MEIENKQILVPQGERAVRRAWRQTGVRAVALAARNPVDFNIACVSRRILLYGDWLHRFGGN